jgi:hypothetical protein
MMQNFNTNLQNTEKANQRPYTFNMKLQHTWPKTFKLQRTKAKSLEPQHKASTHKLTKYPKTSMHQNKKLGAWT